MSKRLSLRFAAISFLFLFLSQPGLARERWTVRQANDWWDSQPWLVGANFIPSTAINQLEMWQADTFDPETIDRELGWASDIGFNSMRVFLHNLLWTQDSEGFLDRIDSFLAIADRHGIGIMFVPLDGVWDPQPKLGVQPTPKPHVHNSGWVQAPGAEILGDPDRHDELKPYIQGLIRRFGNDPRVQAWDLFNEPENTNNNSYGVDGARTEIDNKMEMAEILAKKLFGWAREMDPTQPLTMGVWRKERTHPGQVAPIYQTLLEESDIITFHNYGNLDTVKDQVEILKPYGRPILCTEYMARGNGSRFDPILQYFKDQKIGAYNWGLVAGKSQTQYPWATWTETFTAEPKLWHHDIFRKDGTPYDPAEVAYIKRVMGVD
ncbi:MAG: cellulase family glycosylhydrolase [Candidatus Omnitrophica bacterium]|nr:cellulase family glycosylhydrolase [Candidatus Omnitrophota bacterium]